MSSHPDIIPDESDHSDCLLDSIGRETCTPGASLIADPCMLPEPSLEMVRELDGRCGKCGLQTHLVHIDLVTQKRAVEPLSIPYEVHRGRCLLCYPLAVDTIQRIDTAGSYHYPQKAGAESLVKGPQRSFDGQLDFNRTEDDISELIDILYSMKSYPNTERLQEQGCEALWVHSYDDEQSAVLGRIGGINRILDAMLLFPSNVIIQHSCTEAIQNLASNHYNRILIVNQGGAALLVRAMMLHRDSLAIHCGACRALGNLALCEGLRQDILQAGAGPAIAFSIETFDHRDSLSCNEYESLLSLTHCASNNGGRIKSSSPSLIEKSSWQHTLGA